MGRKKKEDVVEEVRVEQPVEQQEEGSQDLVKGQIRCLVSNVYDLQKLRIAAGNRLVQSFYMKLGIPFEELGTGKANAKAAEGGKETEEEAKEREKAEKGRLKFIDKLKKEYKDLTTAIVDGGYKSNSSITKCIEENSNELSAIRDVSDYKLVESYMKLHDVEESSIKILDSYVKQHPMWGAFFEGVKGCGPLMSAVCIAYLDIRKARYVSSFFRYAGLDTVQDIDPETGEPLYKTDDGRFVKVRKKYVYTDADTGENYFGKVTHTEEYDSDGVELLRGTGGNYLHWEEARDGSGNAVYEEIETGAEYIGDVFVSQHGRRKGDTEMFEYIDKNGEKKLKRGITYNPILKTKLMGVLTGCLLKAKDPVYAAIYYDYRQRLDGSAQYKGVRDAQKNMMAQRYMIKQFLRNMWTTWRELEGLEVNLPYEVAKLGNKPHKYNQYQCDAADRYQKSLGQFAREA